MNGFLFWVLSITWGFPMTFIGAIAALGLIVTGHKPKRFHHLVYFEVGEGWGGVNLGAFFIVSRDADDYVRKHESGHAVQNIIFGWFMPFVVGIPSAIRYWYREYQVKRKWYTYEMLPDYDAIWFEGQATKFGNKYFK